MAARNSRRRTNLYRATSTIIEALEQRVLLSATDAIIVTQPWVTGTDAAHATTTADTTQTTHVTIRAGQPLFVSAVGSGTTNTPQTTFSVPHSDPLNVGYAWDFGDSGAEYDKLPGFSASHVYDTPGTYSVTLTLTEGSQVDTSAPLQVTVNPWPTHVIYVDADNGSDLNNGTSEATPYKNLSTAITTLYGSTYQSNTTIFLKGGTTHSYSVPSNGIDLAPNGSVLHDITIRSWDPSAKATLDGSSLLPNTNWINAGTGGLEAAGEEDYMFEDLNFVGSTTNWQTVIRNSGQNFAFRRCRFEYVARVLDAGSSTSAGALLQDCTVPVDSTMGDAFIYGVGTDYALLGNFVNGSAGENLIRLQWNQITGQSTGATRVLIYGNDLYTGANGLGKTDVTAQVGAFVYVSSNQLNDNYEEGYAPLQFGPLHNDDVATYSTPDSDLKGERIQWCVAENNRVNNGWIDVEPGSDDIMLRNNTITRSTSGPCIDVHQSDANYQRGTADIRILNNTGTESDAGGTFLTVNPPNDYDSNAPKNNGELYLLGQVTTGITLVNNLYIDPNATGGYDVEVDGCSDLNSFNLVSNNLWQPESGGNDFLINGAPETLTTWNSSATLLPNDTKPNDTEHSATLAGGAWSGGAPATAGVFIDAGNTSPTYNDSNGRVWTADNSFNGGSATQFGQVTGATYGRPIKITTESTFGLKDGDTVRIEGVGGNTKANGVYYVKVLNNTTFSLYYDSAFTQGVFGNGSFTGGGTWSNLSGSGPHYGQVTGASNTTPIVVTVPTTSGLINGDTVNVQGVGGNTNANGVFYVEVLSETTFSLYDTSSQHNAIVGNGSYTSGGAWANWSGPGQQYGQVTAASNATPIVVTVPSTFGLYNGDTVSIQGVSGNTNANGVFYIQGLTSTSFSLEDTTPQHNKIAGNGSYTGCALGWTNLSGSGLRFGQVTGASNATPIVITVPSTSGLSNGDIVSIDNVLGNTNANGSFYIQNLTSTAFSLYDPSHHTVAIVGNGAYTPGSGAWAYCPNSGPFFGQVTGASNAAPGMPIVITVPSAYGLSDGDTVNIQGVGGNTNANGVFYIKGVTATMFSLYDTSPQHNPFSGNGSYTGGGTWANWSSQGPLYNQITGASNATPIVITVPSTFGLNNGDTVSIEGVGGNTNANGEFYIEDLTGTSFSLRDTTPQHNFIVGNGTYTSGTGGWSEVTGPGTQWGPITAASNTTPIVITVPSTSGLTNGDTVSVQGIGGNTNANGVFYVEVLSGTTFSLLDTTPQHNAISGNGSYTGGGGWVILSGPGAQYGQVTAASNATPIVVTVPSTFGLMNGDTVSIQGVGGNTNANGIFYIEDLTSTTFSLHDTTPQHNAITGNGSYTSGGSWANLSEYGSYTAGTVAWSNLSYYYQNQDLLFSYREGTNNTSFKYIIPVADGTYALSLYFLEPIPWQQVGARVFNVAAQGNTILSNFDIMQRAGGAQKEDVEEQIVSVTNGQLELDFNSILNEGNPLVSAIAISPISSSTVNSTLVNTGITNYTVLGASYPSGSFYPGASVTNYDLYGNPRPTSGVSVGAVQLPPQTPTSLSASQPNGQVKLTWNPNPAGNVLGYLVYRNSDTAPLNTTFITGTTYTDASPPSGTVNYYVMAVDTGYNESAAATAQVITGQAPPAASNLVAAPLSETEIQLTWTDNSGGQAAFQIWRSSDNVNFTNIGLAPVGSTTYDDSNGLSAGTKEYYYVVATSNGLNAPQSNTANATTFAPPPAATNLVATALSDTEIQLTWKDNSGGQAAYEIERSSDGGNTYAPLNQTAAGAQSYTDTGLAASTTEYYEVVATNHGLDSPDSNVAYATTFPPGGQPTDALIVTQPWVTGSDSAHATTSNNTAVSTQITIRTGQPLFVSGVGALDGNGNKQVNAQAFSSSGSDPLNVGYAWDFGDPNGEYDHLPGFSAAHVYDTPGTYNVQLTLTEGSASAPVIYHSAPLQVVVTQWTPNVIYVDADNGSDSNNGTSEATPYKTLATALNTLYLTDQSNTTIFLKGGTTSSYSLGTTRIELSQTFDATAHPTLHDVTIRSWDPSQKATLDGSALATTWIDDTSDITGEENYMFEDLNFVGSATNLRNVISMAGQNIAFRRCVFENVNGVMEANGANQNAGGLLEDCSAPNDSGIGAEFAYLSGSDYAIIGNFVNGSAGANLIKTGVDSSGILGATRLLIYKNDLYDGHGGDAAIADQTGAFTYVSSNQLITDDSTENAHLQIGPFQKSDDTSGITPTANQKLERVSWVVAENNTFHEASIEVFAGSQDVMLRNNVLLEDANSGYAIEVYDSDANYNDATVDTRILNNTAIYSGTGGYFLYVLKPSYSGSLPPLNGEVYLGSTKATAGITLANNLYVAPNKAAPNGWNVRTDVADLNSFDLVSNNVWVQRSGDSNAFNIGGTAKSISQWNSTALVPSTNHPNDVALSTTAITDSESTDYTPVAADASLVNTGLGGYTIFGESYPGGTFYPGVTTDYYGNPRPLSAITVGAVQLPPPDPSGFAGIESAGSATLTWAPSTATNSIDVTPGGGNDANGDVIVNDVKGYNIYRNNGSTPLNGSTLITGTTYTDASPPAGVVTYRITAVDNGGNESAGVTINVNPEPAAASGVVAAPLSDTTIRLAWVDNSNNETGFEILRSSDGTSFTQIAVAPSGAQMYDDTGLTAGTLEYYKVVATNNGSNAVDSNTSSATTWQSATLAPIRFYSNPYASFTDSQGNSWGPDFYGSGGSTSYSSFPVAGAPAADAEIYYEQRQGNASSPDLTYAIPTADGTYSLRLLFAEPSSSMTAGGRVFNVTAEGTTVLNNFDIVADIGAAQTADIKEMRVTVNDGELDLQFLHNVGYPVISAIELDPAPLLTSVDIGTSTIGNTSIVTDGVAYNLTGNGQVNNNADSLHFAYETITGDFDFATQVTSLTNANPYTLAALMARADLAPGSAQVTVGARASEANGFRFNARPTDNAITDAGYEVGTLADYPYTWIRLTRVGNVFTGYYSVGQQPNGIVWTLIGQETVSLPQTVYFGLSASSYTSGLATATFNDFTATPTPAAATNLTASPADELKIHLAWTDNSNNETGFKIMRSTDGGSTYSLLTTVPHNTQSYDDATVVNGQQYYYEVIATNTYSDAAPSNAANCWAIPTPVLSSVVEEDSNGHPNFTLNWGEHDSNGNYVSYPNDGSYGYQSTDIMHIYWSADNGVTWNLYYYDSTYPVSAQPGTKFINDPGITQVDNIQMVFRIQAENAQGQLSQMSNWFWPNT